MSFPEYLCVIDWKTGNVSYYKNDKDLDKMHKGKIYEMLIKKKWTTCRITEINIEDREVVI